MPNIQQKLSSLEVFLLGEFEVKVGGMLVEENLWLRRSAKSLIKLLALKPQHRLHREQIIDCGRSTTRKLPLTILIRLSIWRGGRLNRILSKAQTRSLF